jgi:hypothetical protein
MQRIERLVRHVRICKRDTPRPPVDLQGIEQRRMIEAVVGRLHEHGSLKAREAEHLPVQRRGSGR